MNKTIKIISTLAIALVLVAVLSQTILATDYSGTISGLDGGTSADLGDVKTKSANILATIRNVAAIAAVFVITFLGFKYMMGSVEEKAGYKKSFIPLIVGIVVILAATSIASFLFKL